MEPKTSKEQGTFLDEIRFQQIFYELKIIAALTMIFLFRFTKVTAELAL